MAFIALTARPQVETQVLPGKGGASGVAESVVDYSKVKPCRHLVPGSSHQIRRLGPPSSKPACPRPPPFPLQHNTVDLVLVGSRGMGALKRSLLEFVGLGSVSDYLVNHLQCPVLVVRHPTDKAKVEASPQARARPVRRIPLSGCRPAAPGQIGKGRSACCSRMGIRPKLWRVAREEEETRDSIALAFSYRQAMKQQVSGARKVLVAVDESEHSVEAVKATVALLRPDDQLHLVSVALPVPYPVMDDAPVRDETDRDEQQGVARR